MGKSRRNCASVSAGHLPNKGTRPGFRTQGSPGRWAMGLMSASFPSHPTETAWKLPRDAPFTVQLATAAAKVCHLQPAPHRANANKASWRSCRSRR